ncbi:MAG: aminotransferase class III-fold pyridoxal phosphate-dependent enzyme [Desulfofustis sp.]|jgi:adenosylmethionine-8-amino-7-oxononanoate aminotransferase|nr:aminotransferase class III-fold pyridoxal phosphate-dependent enzyme [Desulfofustis sp.]
MTESIKKLDVHSRLMLHRTARKDVAGGISVIVKGEGVRVFDENGASYIDLEAGGTRPVHAGYGRTELARAGYDQMCEMAYFTPMGFANVPAMKLADKLADITPPGIDRFIFECDGSEAVETAMKLAKHYHYYRGDKGRFKVVSRRGAYHGVNGIGVRALGIVMPMRQLMEPLAPGAAFIESPYCYRCRHNLSYPACDLACARELERVIEFEGPEQISIFIGEPIQQGFGAYRPPPEYWPVIREICDRYSILLVIDEVICGFGRTGRMFATEHFDLRPDLMTMAKGLTSGYLPLGAVGCTDAVVEPVELLNHLHTYGNHPVSCAVALKNLEILENEELIENSATMGRYFLDGLNTLGHHPSVGEVRGTGLWLAIDFTVDKKSRTPFPLQNLMSIIARAKRKGILVKTMGMALEFAPPLTISTEDIDEVIPILDACIHEEEKAMGLLK